MNSPRGTRRSRRRRTSPVQCDPSLWDIQPDRRPTPAREVYTGWFSPGARRHAERFYPAWVILSAKHGFLPPDDIVSGAYEVSFLKPGPEVVSIERLREQVLAKGLDRHDEIVVIAGRSYAQGRPSDRVRPRLPGSCPTRRHRRDGEDAAGAGASIVPAVTGAALRISSDPVVLASIDLR